MRQRNTERKRETAKETNRRKERVVVEAVVEAMAAYQYIPGGCNGVEADSLLIYDWLIQKLLRSVYHPCYASPGLD